MAHDREGQLLKQGDVVNLPCKIMGIDEHENDINLALETVDPVFPSNRNRHILVNAKQVTLLSRSLGDVPEDAKAISSPEIEIEKTLDEVISDSAMFRTKDLKGE